MVHGDDRAHLQPLEIKRNQVLRQRAAGLLLRNELAHRRKRRKPRVLSTLYFVRFAQQTSSEIRPPLIRRMAVIL